MSALMHGAVWYASSIGGFTNGTRSHPWSIAYSVTNTNPHLHPGDTVLLISGTFVCTEASDTLPYARELEFRKSGTPSSKIRYRAEALWQFNFDGGLLIPPGVSNLVIERCRIYDSTIGNRVATNYYDHSNGITDFGQGGNGK